MRRIGITNQRGFTLLEVIVAVTILALGVTVVLQLFGGGLRSLGISRDYVTATGIVRGKMEEALVQGESGRGTLEERFSWSVEVTEEPAQNERMPAMQRIRATASWPSWRGNRSVELTTRRLLPGDTR